MSDNPQSARKGGVLSALGKFPWVFLVIGYLVVAHLHPDVLPMQVDAVGKKLEPALYPTYGFLALGILVLFVEFFKSGDIGAGAFLLDIVWSVLALVTASVLMSYLYFQGAAGAGGWENINFFHWFGCAIVLGDAILGPFNAFRAALRNIAVS